MQNPSSSAALRCRSPLRLITVAVREDHIKQTLYTSYLRLTIVLFFALLVRPPFHLVIKDHSHIVIRVDSKVNTLKLDVE